VYLYGVPFDSLVINNHERVPVLDPDTFPGPGQGGKRAGEGKKKNGQEDQLAGTSHNVLQFFGFDKDSAFFMNLTTLGDSSGKKKRKSLRRLFDDKGTA
jgi:hypothetical protein